VDKAQRFAKTAGKTMNRVAAMKLPVPMLLLVTDRRQARRPLAEIVGAALTAGCRWVSLREKDLPQDEQVPLARTLLTMTRRHGARLVLHGDAALAKLAGVDGVHLPSGSDAAAARKLLGPEKLVGLSIHTVPEAASIDPEAADYIMPVPLSRRRANPATALRSAARVCARWRMPRACRCSPSAASIPRASAT
jgi:thiamine-phosphate pyrophosphorylase